MRRLISIIILCIGILTNADAQTFTQRIQKQVAGQGSITIRQDSVIDQLVNSATLGIKSSGQAAKPSQTSSTSPTSTSSPSSSTSHTSTTSHTSSTSPTTTSAIPDTIDTSKKIMRGMKITGYRVQVFAVATHVPTVRRQSAYVMTSRPISAPCPSMPTSTLHAGYAAWETTVPTRRLTRCWLPCVISAIRKPPSSREK